MEATRRAWLLATGFVFLGAALQGAEPAAPSNDDCLACHGDATLARGDGRALQPGLERFGGSIHGQAGLACVDCHAELAATRDFPPAEILAPAACVSCHADAVAQ